MIYQNSFFFCFFEIELIFYLKLNETWFWLSIEIGMLDGKGVTLNNDLLFARWWLEILSIRSKLEGIFYDSLKSRNQSFIIKISHRKKNRDKNQRSITKFSRISEQIKTGQGLSAGSSFSKTLRIHEQVFCLEFRNVFWLTLSNCFWLWNVRRILIFLENHAVSCDCFYDDKQLNLAHPPTHFPSFGKHNLQSWNIITPIIHKISFMTWPSGHESWWKAVK